MGKKLKDLTEKTSLTGNEEVYINDGGTDKKVKTKNMGGMTPEERKKLTALDLNVRDLNARQGAYPAFPDIPLTLAVSGKVIGTDGQLVSKAGYGISAPVEVQKGNTYRFPSSEAIGGHALFAQVLTREVAYTITMQSYSDGSETRERIERISTTRGIGGISRVYRCVYSGENDTIVGIWQDSAEDGYSWQSVPGVGWKNAILNPKMLGGTPMTSELLYADITSAAGGQVAIRPSYTEYSPKFNANGVVSLTANGEYVLLSSFEGLMVVSGKLADLSEGKVLHQSRDGKDASMANQLAAKADVDMLALLYKRGVVSQTQTWYGDGKESWPSMGDYYYYVMNNVITGIIPQASIDIFAQMGAEFNDSETSRQKIMPWGETIEHKAGYFYYNGIGDLSYAEMLDIYNAPKPHISSYGNIYDNESKCARYNARTFAYNDKLTEATTMFCKIGDARYLFSNSPCEIIRLHENINNVISGTLLSWIFSYSQKIRVIANPFDVNGDSNALPNSGNLEYAKFKNVRQNVIMDKSAKLSISSILYMIQNATNGTSNITIKLHKNAYDRAVADAEIQAALAANGHIQLLSA